MAAHADDGYVHMEHHRDEAQQLVGLTGVGDGEHHVVGGHHAQVTVEHVQWVDEERGCACRGEGGGDLRTDMSALSHACDDDLALAVVHQFDSLLEFLIELLNQSEHGCCLVLETLYGVISCGQFIYDLRIYDL